MPTKIIMPKLKKNPNSKRVRREGETKQGLSLMEYISLYRRLYQEEEAKRRNCPYWSELPRDLLHSVLQRLSFTDLRRAKSVCSAWLSASRQCTPKSQVPWLILFPAEDYNGGCKLFNPAEKDKMYTSQQDLGGVGSVCVATHEYWLLMRNPRFDLYIVNLLTGQRINLPPPESQRGKTNLERIGADKFRAEQFYVSSYIRGDTIGFEIKSPRLWVDEGGKDYFVVFSLRPFCFHSSFATQYTLICKRGDHSWTRIPDCSPCRDMVYSHPKLYVYRYDAIQIFDFSSSSSRDPPEPHVYEASFSSNIFETVPLTIDCTEKKNIVLSVTGLVLMVVSVMSRCRQNWSFGIYKKSSRWTGWDKVKSLGDEAMLLDLGITVPAKDIQGVNADCIYFSGGEDGNDVFIFDIRTEKIHESVVSLSLHQYSRSRWFFPGFSRKISS